MKPEQISNAIRTRFKTQIAEARELPTEYDNQPKLDEDKKKGLWCRFTIRQGDSSQQSLGDVGSRRYRHVGIAYAQLFMPLGNGDKAQMAMAGHIETAFRGVTDTGVHFQTPSVKTVGRSENYWQVNVHCPFYADDIG